MRRRALALLAGLLVTSTWACDRRTWTGRLGTSADSIFATRPESGCVPVSGDLGFQDVALPLVGCSTARGDTTLAVTADADHKVLIVSRSFHVDTARQAAVHDSLEMFIGALYEASSGCPENDASAETNVRLWKTLDRQIALKNRLLDTVVVEVRADHPGCPTGAQ